MPAADIDLNPLARCDAMLPTIGVMRRFGAGPNAWAAQSQVPGDCVAAWVVPVTEVPGTNPVEWTLVPNWNQLTQKLPPSLLQKPAAPGVGGSTLQCDATVDFAALSPATAVVFLFIMQNGRIRVFQKELPFKIHRLAQVMSSLILPSALPPTDLQMQDAVALTIGRQKKQPLTRGLLSKSAAGSPHA